jgi:hypothetical protein
MPARWPWAADFLPPSSGYARCHHPPERADTREDEHRQTADLGLPANAPITVIATL